ncbi:MAG: methyltransferase domain-containing protein [Gammaproteobacteria bacterium]|nr:methyltransferase domain-containing protein [Gammaproteobacteria bacterium]
MSVNPELVRWDEKYRHGVTPFFIEPKGESELVDWFTRDQEVPQLEHGLALEVACGRGANAMYLASLGYDVIAVDGSLEGIRSCQRSASHLELPVYPVVMDLEQVVLPKSQFKLISVVRYLQRSLIAPLIDALAPGGLLFFKTFNQRFLVHKPNFPVDFVLQSGELSNWFGSYDVLATNEFDDGVSTSSYMLVRKPVELET